MSEKKVKVLIEFDNVRVIENDVRNVEVQELKSVTNPSTKEATNKWRFRGYSATILSALRLILKEEMLINRGEIEGLKSHLYSVGESNKKVLEAIENARL